MWVRGEEDSGGVTAGEKARNVSMLEIEDNDALRALFRAYQASDARDLFITHAAVGVESDLWAALDLDPILHGGMSSLLGAELLKDADVPNDALIIFAGPFMDGRLEETTVAFKVHLVT